MSDLTLVLLAAGEATRFQKPVKKQWLRIGSVPLWLHVLETFRAMRLFKDLIVVGHSDELHYMKRHIDDRKVTFVEGGASRHASLKNALETVHTPLVLVSDVARPCVNKTLCKTLQAAVETADCAVPALPVPDTVYYEGRPIDRKHLLRIQTPQLSRTAMLKKALATEREFTDESSAIHQMGGKVAFVGGDASLHKLTFSEDIALLPCLTPPDMTARFTGTGFDVHAFEENKPMLLGGVQVDAPYGFRAHSDGDVAIHALIDALMGAAGMGDIGELFPDTEAAWAGADSAKLLRHVVHLLTHTGFEILQADITIMAQIPKIGPYKDSMRFRLAELLGISPQYMNIKATTTEKLGFVGRKEGVAVQASATLKLFDWTRP
ncbi:bifunctional 2-C-methyl-D-erythritol 4-phosphate cytidylyltransferase/2-C-methyl-D-erythritol 2,4-cyclodiphosphate synthase [Hydrogenimonas urashimensis]|uniref:bifunctional 2-C-methyl-D-erythritol 4-phosphate cytidylyltransferase/2-C-methyl-D-erythritol 2,4-cyclodiphosphate synthase n=1 Tax=Hydrogenimonas urashimensis TaxID=2740515 RepID=UPI001916B666|nr:bifunctional 2-C-methyl-D-erythritol 4-phosphate cytidylyltransferase/2-C-methyl-D-erythritol 2,4-cyclodiphosphate synthase [Hydrogenimonas urashimensis]